MLDFARWIELLLLLGLALLILGPKELPRILYRLGVWVRKIRFFIEDIQGQFDTFMYHMDQEEARKEAKKDSNSPHS